MEIKVEVQLRCNTCDTVLSTSITAMKDGVGIYAYVDPCPKCAAQQGFAVDVSNAFCNCAKAHFDLVEKCSECGKPPRH